LIVCSVIRKLVGFLCLFAYSIRLYLASWNGVFFLEYSIL